MFKRMSTQRFLQTVWKSVRIFLAIMLIATPLSFFWVNELVMTYTGQQLTNGFVVFDGLKNYHIAMYWLMGTNLLAAFVLLRGW